MALPFYVLLDRIRSAYNVGSIFRSCDSAGVDKLILTSFTATPPHPKLEKTALGSLKSVPWEHHCSPFKAAQYYRSQGFRLVSLENTPQADNIFSTQFSQPTCLIVGNEIDGVSQEILDLSDQILKIPHFGIKNSLNVAVATGIAVYQLQRQRLSSTT